ncbi:MAG: lipoprotein [Rickettsiales bacterium]
MRRAVVVVGFVAMACALLVSSCGVKGDLYRSKPAKEKADGL